ncbi:MAG: MogA/MoaB family molybdenum cofactor biosynthesis protein [Bacillati bacterium ANGP1]|uniref:MogA/MoaB family molybdenum cofactor biosynthesis protein n=1 Tax=Candidatus Segetimicrobium genomatis TaxID=2569760 RepID=A0A537JJ36_9BACT|nr:MAG: MogA/MoaB family molybdenum cofactor biosynthesis protein [Terrabacteria group bacterium ANGP1]
MSAEQRLRGVRCGILTASERVSRGQGKNESGQYLAQTVGAEGGEVIAHVVVPDDVEMIAKTLADMADTLKVDLVLTTGGSGVAPRDVTPEATLRVIERQVPGIPEAARVATAASAPLAMVSRAIAGIRGRTLIVNLPGSPRGVREWMAVILPVLRHTVELLRETPLEWGREHKP